LTHFTIAQQLNNSDIVFQESVNTSIKARDYGELIKSLSGLNDLYKIKKVFIQIHAKKKKKEEFFS
jgi:hypothetical protein